MKWVSSLLAAQCLILAPLAAAPSLPPVVERYEQLLVRSPGKGTAFDKVYQHFFEGEGLEKLAARWTGRAAAGGPEAPTYEMLLGVLAERQGRSADAIRLFQKAAAARPADARLWSALGEAEASAGHLPEAIKALQKALAANPAREARPALFRQLARSQQRAFDGEGALKTWQQFVAESPNDPFALEEAADAMAEVERFAEAKTHYEKLRDFAGIDPYRRVIAILKLGQLEEKQGRREAARALYESALPLAAATSWIHREVRARIEESYRRQDDLPGLAAYYEARLKLPPRDVDGALRLSEVLLELNRKSDAVMWLRQASEWAPERKEVLVALAKRLGEIKQPQEAVGILTKLTQAHPEEESFREFLGDAHWQVFQATKDEAAREAAIVSWRQLAPAATKDASKASRVADLFRARELPAEALEHYARAVQLAPEAPELQQRWAEYLFDLKRQEEGLVVLREMVAGPRATAPNFLRLARLLQRRADLAGALEAVAKGLAQAPADFELLMLQWRLFSETQKWEEAAGIFERLLAAAPSVYSVDQVEDQQLQALRGLGRLEETSKQLAGRLGQTPALSEADLRLLLRITLQGSDLDTAGEALAEARQRFPASAALLRREVEYEKRKGNLPGRVAALERLIALQPKQQLEWRREIARAYQDEGLWDQALAAAQRLMEEAPASPEAHLLASDLNFAALRFDAGVAKLRDAIKLSDRPNDLRLRLARVFAEAGRGEEARQTFDLVFEAETDPKARLALTRQLAEVYLAQGSLDELIGRFRQRQRAEEGGWRYALYLAEIFQQMQDFAGAREELSKALGARSRDGNFLRQLARLAEAEGNTLESARYARLLAEAEPGEAHQIDLAEALLDNGETEEALKILRANDDGFARDPTAWREVLLKLHRADAGEALAGALRANLERRPGDWRGRLMLAELQLGLGDFAGAERWLWDILKLPREPAAPGPAPSTTATLPQSSRAFLDPDADTLGYHLRLAGRERLQMNLAEILAGQNSGRSRGRGGYGRGSMGGPGSPSGPASLEEACDAAIFYLATVAQQQDRAASFLAALEKHLASTTRAERIVVYSLVEAGGPLLREIRLEAAQPSGEPDLDALCLRTLINGIRQTSIPKESAADDLALIEVFLRRERRPERMLTAKMMHFEALNQAGRGEAANRLADEVLAQADKASLAMLPPIFAFALQRQALDVAERILPHLVAAGAQPGNAALLQQISWYRFALASALLRKKETLGRGVQLLAGMLRESYPTNRPAALATFSSYTRRSHRSAWSDGEQFPFPNRYLDDARIQMWRQLFTALKSFDALGEMKEELNRHLQTLPDDQTIYTQLARACFWWWDGATGEAIREVSQLARELQDDDLRLMVSTMLAEVGQPAEALKVLEQVSATAGHLGTDKLVRMLVLARAADDLERAQQIALALAGQRLNAEDESRMVNALEELGLKEKAAELNKRQAAGRARGTRNRIEDQLRQQVRDKNEKQAVALARTILARDPLPLLRQGDQSDRQQALNALRTFKQFDAYCAELEQQLAGAPTSVRAVYLLAEAHGRHDGNRDSGKALGYFRRLVELKPADTTFQLQLAALLVSKNQPEEAMRVWETVLARDPEPLMRSAFSDMLTLYTEKKQLPRLGAALLKTPKRTAASATLARYGGGGTDYSESFHQVATELQKQGHVADALALWQVALDESLDRRSGNEQSILGPLLSALLETGDDAGAVGLLERYFFPENKPALLFGSHSTNDAKAWLQVSSSGRGRWELPAATLLAIAGPTGALDHLRRKALAPGEDEETAGLLVLLIDLQRQDAGSLADLAARARSTLRSAVQSQNYSSLLVLQYFAQALRDWPAARPLALELMLELERSAERDENDRDSLWPQTQSAELAAELGETETARTLLRNWSVSLQRNVAIGRTSFDAREQIPVMETMTRLGLIEEARDLLRAMKSRVDFRNNEDARLSLASFENRLALLTGEGGRARLAAWAVPPSGAVAPTVICWEISPLVKMPRGDSRRQEVMATGEDLPALDGRYEVELFHGATPSAMRKLVTLPAAKSRGSWSSPASLAGGFVLAVARDKTGVLFSTATPAPFGPNLLINPALHPANPPVPRAREAAKARFPGWSVVSEPESLIKRSAGPRSGGEATYFWQNTRSNPAQLTQRVPLQPGKSYLFTAWLQHSENQDSIRLIGRFVDRGGEKVGELNSGSPDRSRWFQAQSWLVPGRSSDDREQAIPETAVAIELMIEISGEGALDSLYFGEIDRPDNPAIADD